MIFDGHEINLALNPGPVVDRAILIARRGSIADEIEQQERDAQAWSRMHPDEDPIAIDADLVALARHIRALEEKGR